MMASNVENDGKYVYWNVENDGKYVYLNVENDGKYVYLNVESFPIKFGNIMWGAVVFKELLIKKLNWWTHFLISAPPPHHFFEICSFQPKLESFEYLRFWDSRIQDGSTPLSKSLDFISRYWIFNSRYIVDI